MRASTGLSILEELEKKAEPKQKAEPVHCVCAHVEQEVPFHVGQPLHGCDSHVG